MRVQSLCLALVSFCLASSAPASQVLWGSARLATNYMSQGEPSTLDNGFTFQLGAFTEGFVPTAENTDAWLDHWVPAQSTRYNAQTHFFTGSFVYQENVSPFLPSNQGYIFGFNRWAASEGSRRAEWILATDPGWHWPSGGAISPPVQWSMSSASHVILGTVGGSSSPFHMMTAAVDVPLETLTPELWSRRYLGSAPDRASLTADLDHDGLSNALELLLGTNPQRPDHGRYVETKLVKTDQGLFPELAFFKFGLVQGATLGVQVSHDLETWEPAADAFEVRENSLFVYRARARLALQPGDPQRYYRLVAAPSE